VKAKVTHLSSVSENEVQQYRDHGRLYTERMLLLLIHGQYIIGAIYIFVIQTYGILHC
jgi:hypothetical protein